MKEESIKDTLLDLMGYSLIATAMQIDEWREGGRIYSSDWRKLVYAELDALFARKLADYGTKDLGSVDQIAQRMHEKLYRIENLLKGKGGDDHKFRIKKHTEEVVGILPPQKAGDVGFDLVVSEDTEVHPIGHPLGAQNVPLGFSAKIPAGYWAEIRPRSSTPSKLKVFVHQSVMDEGYTGPWFAVCHSLTIEPVKVEKGTRIAQCILHKGEVPPLEFVEELPQTERGATGFGSSGLKIDA